MGKGDRIRSCRSKGMLILVVSTEGGGMHASLAASV